jgi:hypothetical protein
MIRLNKAENERFLFLFRLSRMKSKFRNRWKRNKVGWPFKSSLLGKEVGYDALQKHYESSKSAVEKKKIQESVYPRSSHKQCRKQMTKKISNNSWEKRGLESFSMRMKMYEFYTHEALSNFTNLHIIHNETYYYMISF